MKFFSLFVVALLALNVAAKTTVGKHTETTHLETDVVHYKSFFESEFGVALKTYYNYIKHYLAEPLTHLVEKFYEAFQRIEKLVPKELTIVFGDLQRHMPTFEQFFPHDFITSFGELFITIADTYFPPESFAVFGKFFESIPKVTDFVPREVLYNFGTYLSNVPVVREVYKNTYLVLEQLVHHENHHY
ncbi:uncharacterized protein LOC119631287 [Glossina fuscipes]|uniref:Uncharacterized protein LOC119631287 n=1 Tax=Glossina fuscipes TaxID=7396 RepID=A0A8U0W2B1_9MUSC|nr:uncharacterized protein LOC119631287 [Glossina fuscipes]KAI9586757.1 hypothetical protein GQX74_002604 [Glossina fuscipes]